MTFQIQVKENKFFKIPTLEDTNDVYKVINADREHLRVFLPWVNFALSSENTKKILRKEMKILKINL